MKRFETFGFNTLGRALIALTIASTFGCLAGCSTSGYNNGGPTNPTPDAALTGNWQFVTAPTAGGSLFQSLSGFIYEESGAAGTQLFTTSAFQIQTPTSCYFGSETIPSQGYAQGANLQLRSFSVNGQFMLVKAAINATGTQLTGTYAVSGGCANSAAGTIVGTRYAALTGTYSGPIDGTTPAKTLQLSITQYVQGNGDGVFLVTGSAAINGFACFTTGTLTNTGGAVSGSSVHLAFNTPDPSGAQMVLDGSFDPAADTITLTSINITSGSCEGSYGTATLNLKT